MLAGQQFAQVLERRCLQPLDLADAEREIERHFFLAGLFDEAVGKDVISALMVWIHRCFGVRSKVMNGFVQ